MDGEAGERSAAAVAPGRPQAEAARDEAAGPHLPPAPDRGGATWSRWRGRLVVALVVVLTAELFVRIIEPGIAPTDRYGVNGTLQKERQMQTLAESGPVDIVFAGTSQTLLGVSPELVAGQAGDGLRAYNAAIPGGTPSVQVDWLLEVVVPILQPRQVVLGVSSLDLAARSPRLVEVIESWQDAPANRSDLLGRIDRTVSDWSALVEHRRALRDPAEWWRAARRRLDDRPGPIPDPSRTVTPFGHDRLWWDLDYQGSDELLAWMRHNVVPGYQIGSEQVGALRRMLAELDERGIDVVLLDMPVTDDLVAMHPRAIADVEAADEVFRAEAAAAGVPILRVADGPWPSELFADPIHVNGLGGELLSRFIAEDIAAGPDGLVVGGDHTASGQAEATRLASDPMDAGS